MTLWRDPVGWWCALGRPLSHLSRGWAIGVLALLLLALAWSSWATVQLAGADDARVAAKTGERIGDLELYNRIHTRFAAGDSYYAAALDEQRSHNYPTRPFVTVRLPTLAWIDGHVSETVWKGTALALLVAIVLAWMGALTPLALRSEVLGASVLLFVAGVGLYDARALQFHELVTGGLLTLALGVYRPHRWWPSLLLAALALAIRELALPFVLLWGVLAAFERRWREAAAIGLMIGLFVVAMVFHAQAVAPHVLVSDPASPGWDGFNGPQMALYSLAKLTALLFLPMALAAPVALLALLGWVALGGRLGLFASLWFIGFAIALALFARTNNFYWVLVVLPAYGAGLAFVPRALAELVQGALGGQTSQS
jgi:hypothetical protein